MEKFEPAMEQLEMTRLAITNFMILILQLEYFTTAYQDLHLQGFLILILDGKLIKN